MSEALFKEPCLWHTCMAHCDCGPTPQQSAQVLTLCPAALQVPERYFQMLLALHGLQNETFPNGWLTWTDWGRTDPTGRALLLFSHNAVSGSADTQYNFGKVVSIAPV